MLYVMWRTYIPISKSDEDFMIRSTLPCHWAFEKGLRARTCYFSHWWAFRRVSRRKTWSEDGRISAEEFAALRAGKAGCLCILGAIAIAGMADVGRGWMPCENQTREQLRAVSPVTGRMPWGESKLGVLSPLGQLHLRVPRPRSSSRRGKIESRSVSEVGSFDGCSAGPIYVDLSEAKFTYFSSATSILLFYVHGSFIKY